VTLPNPTIQAAFLGVAQQFAQFVRMGVGYGGAPVDSNTGLPVRTLEMGQFGAPATVHLVTANGADPEAAGANGLIQLVATIDQTPANVENLVNVCIPFGGNSSNTIVNLERLWRIINDPQYINYGRFGPDADSIARTGLPSLFTQYDNAYPISDPENPPTGAFQWLFFDTAGNPLPGGTQSYGVQILPRASDGTVALHAFDAQGFYQPNVVVELAQGNAGTRRFTLGGDGDYVVYDAASYATYGYSEGELIDSGLTYADNSPANQELTEIALYVEAVTNFKRFGHPHQTFACTVENATGRPTRAGDLISVDVERMSEDDTGAVVELVVAEDLKVMSVVRTFSQNAPPSDAYTLSNLGRFDENDTFGAASTQQTMVALQLQQGTAPAPFPIGPVAADVDAATPMEIPLIIPAELFRWHKCVLRVDFQNYRGTGTTAENVAGTPIEFGVPHGDHTIAPQAGHAFGTTGIGTTSDPIGGMPDHEHDMDVLLGTGAAPTAADNWLSLSVGGHGGNFLRASRSAPSDFVTGFVHQTSFNLSPTDHPHTVPIQSAVSVATSLTATLPAHVHPINQQINKGPLPVDCTVSIDGQLLSSGVLVTAGTRDPVSGAFTSSFQVDDISAFISKPGQTVMLVLSAGTDAGNPFGVGRFQATLVAFGEWGSLTSTTRAN
jgi:hypothetical protein